MQARQYSLLASGGLIYINKNLSFRLDTRLLIYIKCLPGLQGCCFVGVLRSLAGKGETAISGLTKIFLAKARRRREKQLYVCNNVGRALPDCVQLIDIP